MWQYKGKCFPFWQATGLKVCASHKSSCIIWHQNQNPFALFAWTVRFWSCQMICNVNIKTPLESLAVYKCKLPYHHCSNCYAAGPAGEGHSGSHTFGVRNNQCQYLCQKPNPEENQFQDPMYPNWFLSVSVHSSVSVFILSCKSILSLYWLHVCTWMY